MSKPIEFKPVRVVDADRDPIVVSASNASIVLVARDNARFEKPEQLGELIDALIRARNALVESQRLRFEDISAGEWFKSNADQVYMKLQDNHVVRVEGVTREYFKWASDADGLVKCRLRASFEELP